MRATEFKLWVTINDTFFHSPFTELMPSPLRSQQALDRSRGCRLKQRLCTQFSCRLQLLLNFGFHNLVILPIVNLNGQWSLLVPSLIKHLLACMWCTLSFLHLKCSCLCFPSSLDWSLCQDLPPELPQSGCSAKGWRNSGWPPCPLPRGNPPPLVQLPPRAGRTPTTSSQL